MSICICGESARKLLEGLPEEQRQAVMPIEAEDVFFETPTRGRVAELYESIWGEVGSKVDILVRDQRQRRGGKKVANHVWSEAIPPGSLLSVTDDIVIPTPLFDLLEQARNLSPGAVSKRIMELTSKFAIDKASEDGFVESPPLVTREELEDYFRTAHRLRGVRMVSRAMAWSPPLARSPREIDLTLPLTMPREFLGCGMPVPELNHKISLGRRSGRMLGQDTCYVDLYWPGPHGQDDSCGAEYLGKRRHKNIGEELTRANALELEGVEVHLVANEQLMDATQLLMIAKRIAHRIGFSPKDGLWPSETELQSLIDNLVLG